jgi:hypothetical protein
VVVLHGARYSPHDNPVERLRQVHAFFRQRSPTQILATAAPSSSPSMPQGYMQNFREAA